MEIKINTAVVKQPRSHGSSERTHFEWKVSLKSESHYVYSACDLVASLENPPVWHTSGLVHVRSGVLHTRAQPRSCAQLAGGSDDR